MLDDVNAAIMSACCSVVAAITHAIPASVDLLHTHSRLQQTLRLRKRRRNRMHVDTPCSSRPEPSSLLSQGNPVMQFIEFHCCKVFARLDARSESRVFPLRISVIFHALSLLFWHLLDGIWENSPFHRWMRSTDGARICCYTSRTGASCSRSSNAHLRTATPN